jgi:7,8-dihydroneopterin aldolase/epimerase/oxygenase
MTDLQIIRIDDAKAIVRLGVPEPERANPQEVRISVAMALRSPPDFPENDRILHFIRDDLGTPAHLVETLADRVAGHCLSLSPRVQWVEVTVKKPSVLSGDGLVSVMIRREAP